MGFELVPVLDLGRHVTGQREAVDGVQTRTREQRVHTFAIRRGRRQRDEVGDVGREPAQQLDGIVAALNTQVDVLAKNSKLTRQVTVHFGQVLEARGVRDGPFLPPHEGVGAATGNRHTDGISRFDQGVAHLAHFGQQAHGVLVHRRIQFNHGPRDLGFDAVGNGVIGHLGQQLVRGCGQVKSAGVDQLQLKFDAQGVGGRRNERDRFHSGLL